MSANGLHRIRWRRVAVARIHRTAASQFARDLKCRQTDSIGSDGDGLPWQESIGLPQISSRET